MPERRAWGRSGVAVIDFDVHHGNGTQAACSGTIPPSLLRLDPSDAALSRDRSGCTKRIAASPPTTWSTCPLPPMAPGPSEFREAMSERLSCPALRAVRSPELVIVSAGFDAHAGRSRWHGLRIFTRTTMPGRPTSCWRVAEDHADPDGLISDPRRRLRPSPPWRRSCDGPCAGFDGGLTTKFKTSGNAEKEGGNFSGWLNRKYRAI